MENVIPDKHWYVIYVRYRFEKKIAGELAKAGYEIYLPIMETIRQWSDRKKKIEEPLFNSYLFIHCNRQELKSIIFPKGVLTVVSFSGAPAIVPDEQITGLKLLLETGEQFEITGDRLNPGDAVEVMRGPLRGLKGTLTDFSGRKHVLLAIEALHLNIVVSIDPQFIKKIISEREMS